MLLEPADRLRDALAIGPALTGRDPRSNLEALTHLVDRMESVWPEFFGLGSAATVATDIAAAVNGGQPIEPEPTEAEPAESPTSLDAMRAWVDGIGDEPKEGIGAEDWERFKLRIKDVAGQAERLLEHGWSLSGLFGRPNALLAQAYSPATSSLAYIQTGACK